MHAREVHARETHAYEMHTRKVHVYEMHTHEMHSHKIHAHKIPAREICALSAGGRDDYQGGVRRRRSRSSSAMCPAALTSQIPNLDERRICPGRRHHCCIIVETSGRIKVQKVHSRILSQVKMRIGHFVEGALALGATF